MSPQQILCVRRSLLEERLGSVPLGLTTDPEILRSFQQVVAEAGEFGPRPSLEEDPTFLQVIVQCVVISDGKVLSLFRKVREAGKEHFVETRHNAKVALSAGGHVEPVEAAADHMLRAAQMRELEEEIVCDPPLEARRVQPVGVLYRDTSLFDRVHIGFVSLAQVTGIVRLPPASDEFDHVEFSGPERLRELLPRMEGWGQILAQAILDGSLRVSADAGLGKF